MGLDEIVAARNGRIEGALKAAAAPAEPWKLSTWTAGIWRSCAVDPDAPGGGVPIDEKSTTATELADSLLEYAPTYVGDKQGGPLALSYSVHIDPSRGGHKDEDCGAITGLILDCDAGGDPEKLLVALMRAGISFTFSMKPSTGKFHIIVQLKTLCVPRDETGSVQYGYARGHQALFQFAILRLSELGVVTFDLAMASILMHMDFPACRKIESDPLPVIEGFDGGCLDLDNFCAALGYVPAPPMKRPPRVKVDPSDAKSVTAEEAKVYLTSKLKVFSFLGKSERGFRHAERMRVALEGRAPVTDGNQRNEIWYKEIVGTAGAALSRRFALIDNEALAIVLTEVFRPALEAQGALDRAAKRRLSPADTDKLQEMFGRSIADIRARDIKDEEREKKL